MTTAPQPQALPKGITLKDLARYTKLVEGLKALTVEKDAINARIKGAYSLIGIVKGTFIYPSAAGTFVVDLGESFSVDTETLAEDFPSDVKPEFYKFVLDTKVIPKTVLDTYRTIPVPKLQVKKA